jgi:acyl-CoA thioesterase FadM
MMTRHGVSRRGQRPADDRSIPVSRGYVRPTGRSRQVTAPPGVGAVDRPNPPPSACGARILRYGDMDTNGHVNSVAILVLRGRTGGVRALRRPAAENPVLSLAKVTIEFRRGALPGIVRVGTRILFGRSSCRLVQGLFRTNCITTSEAVSVCFDTVARKTCRTPRPSGPCPGLAGPDPPRCRHAAPASPDQLPAPGGRRRSGHFGRGAAGAEPMLTPHPIERHACRSSAAAQRTFDVEPGRPRLLAECCACCSRRRLGHRHSPSGRSEEAASC